MLAVSVDNELKEQSRQFVLLQFQQNLENLVAKRLILRNPSCHLLKAYKFLPENFREVSPSWANTFYIFDAS